jgi:hypothetical protein
VIADLDAIGGKCLEWKAHIVRATLRVRAQDRHKRKPRLLF